MGQLKAAGIDVPPLQSSIDIALALALGKEPDPSVLPKNQQQSSFRFMRSIKPPRKSVCQELYKSWDNNPEEGIPFLRSFFTIDPRPKEAQPNRVNAAAVEIKNFKAKERFKPVTYDAKPVTVKESVPTVEEVVDATPVTVKARVSTTETVIEEPSAVKAPMTSK